MSSKIIERGAEANIILTGKRGEKFIIKDRTKKSYRLKEIDERIRFRRTKSEAKILEKASKIINVPEIFLQPRIKNSSKLKMSFVQGKKISSHLNNFHLSKQKKICEEIGKNIANIHDANIIHGDLTTSNMILVDSNGKKSPNKNNLNNSGIKLKNSSGVGGWENGNELDSRVVFIDFGLGFISPKIEDKAVDLHLLEQALEAKHFEHWKDLFSSVLKGYSSGKDSKKVLEQFKKIKSRGRYKEKYL